MVREFADHNLSAGAMPLLAYKCTPAARCGKLHRVGSVPVVILPIGAILCGPSVRCACGITGTRMAASTLARRRRPNELWEDLVQGSRQAVRRDENPSLHGRNTGGFRLRNALTFAAPPHGERGKHDETEDQRTRFGNRVDCAKETVRFVTWSGGKVNRVRTAC